MAAQDTISLYYQTDKYNLEDSSLLKLTDFCTLVSDQKIKEGILIFGYADYVGSDDSNFMLSGKRALFVKKFLLSKGVKVKFISVCQGFGERNCKHIIMPENGCAIHRRVDLVFEKATPPKVIIVKSKSPNVKDKIAKKNTVKNAVAVEMVKLDSVIKISKVGETLILDNINFYGDSDKWLDSSLPAVNNLLNIMKTNKTLQIEIQGHICCKDNDVNDVSTKRAYTVYQLLINNGIEKNRLSYKGFGRTKPLVNEIDEPSRSKNRRVEIYIKRK